MEIIDKHLPKGVKHFTVMPVGDIQYGSKGCAVHHLQRDISKAADRGWYLCGMGDYLDHYSPSNRRALMAAKGAMYDSAQELLDSAIYDRVKELAGVIKETGIGSKQWLGLIQGDHEWTFGDGQPSDALLAKMLGAPYMGHSAIIRVFSSAAPERPFRIFVTHGRGASVTPNGKTARLVRLANAFEADAVLLGHAHLRYGTIVERMIWRDTKVGPDLIAEKRVLGITGSYLKGYEKNTSRQGWPAGSYVEAGAMAPVSLGSIRFECDLLKHDWGHSWDIEVTA